MFIKSATMRIEINLHPGLVRIDSEGFIHVCMLYGGPGGKNESDVRELSTIARVVNDVFGLVDARFTITFGPRRLKDVVLVSSCYSSREIRMTFKRTA